MKKALSILLVLMMLLTICACGNDDLSTESTSTETETTAPSTEATTECTHTYTETVTKEASCAEEGVKTLTCSKCGDSYTESIAKTSHDWKDATCVAPKTCNICGITEGATTEHKYHNDVCVYCNELSPRAIEYESGLDAYARIKRAHELSVEVMDSIYGAWHFAIYKADDYYSAQSCFNAFISNANLDYDEALNALNTVLLSMGISDPTGTDQLAALRVFSIAVDVVVQVYIDNGTYDLINTNLSDAKTSLKAMTNDYESYTDYATLKSYYSEVVAYSEFCQSPTGSFTQLQTTIDNYETNLRNYRNSLSFTYE